MDVYSIVWCSFFDGDSGAVLLLCYTLDQKSEFYSKTLLLQIHQHFQQKRSTMLYVLSNEHLFFVFLHILWIILGFWRYLRYIIALLHDLLSFSNKIGSPIWSPILLHLPKEEPFFYTISRLLCAAFSAIPTSSTTHPMSPLVFIKRSSSLLKNCMTEKKLKC